MLGCRRCIPLHPHARPTSLQGLQRLPRASGLDSIIPVAHSLHFRGTGLPVQRRVRRELAALRQQMQPQAHA